MHRPCRGKTVILVAGMAWWIGSAGLYPASKTSNAPAHSLPGQAEAQGSASSPAGRRAVGRLIRATPSGSRSAATPPGPGRFGPAPGLTALAAAGSGWFAKTHRLVGRSSSRCRAGSRSCSRRPWAAPAPAGRGAGRGGRASLAVRARRHRRRGVRHPGLGVRHPGLSVRACAVGCGGPALALAPRMRVAPDLTETDQGRSIVSGPVIMGGAFRSLAAARSKRSWLATRPVMSV